MQTTFTDQLNRQIQLPESPQKIVCLVPSLTELLFDLGLENRVVGITKFCFEPAHWFKTKTKIGGTKTLDFDKICALQPSLIIANKEENDKQQVEQLAALFPTYTTQIVSIQSAIEAIMAIGKITQTEGKAAEIAQKITQNLAQINNTPRLKVAYLVWNEPLMVAGGDTFIHTMLDLAGFDNIFATQMRYPIVNVAQIQAPQPHLLLLPSEPFPFKKKHLANFKNQFPKTTPVLVQGDMFSWYGSRMKGFLAYIQQLRQEIIGHNCE